MQRTTTHGAFKRLALPGAAASLALCCAAAAQEPLTVRITVPEQRAFSHTTTQPAAAEAFYEADLGAKVSGFVAELLVDVGSRVTAGQVLARLAVPEIDEARNAAQAEVAARASEHERTAMLAERNSVTQKALAEAKNRLDTAVAELAEVEARLQYATVEAPFAGVITARSIDPGDMVFEASSPKGGDEPLLKVAKLDVIRVKTYVPERDAVWVDIGDAAAITFDALPGRSFTGTVARLSGAIDPATRTMLVEVDLPNEDGAIRPGFYGQTRIALESRERALALPTSAIRFGDGDAHVFVVDGAAARRTNVVTGLSVGGWIEIVSGLNGAERIIAAPPATLADGAPVRLAAQ